MSRRRRASDTLLHAGEICKRCNFYLGEAKIKLIELNGGARFLQMDLENEEKYVFQIIHYIVVIFFPFWSTMQYSSNGIF